MRKKSIIVIVFAGIILMSIMNIISASIYFSGLSPTYNLGDVIEADIILVPEDDAPFSLVLTCDNSSLEVYKGAPPEKIQLPLTSLWMKGLTGVCYFTGNYLGEQKESTRFKISKRLELTLDTTSFFSNPGESINISGNANKLSGIPINGEAEINIPGISGSKIYAPVLNGIFNIEYIIPLETPAGDYRIDIIIYEKTDNEKTSEGMEMADLTVFSLASSIDIALDNPRIDPGETLSIKPVVIDQSQKNIESEISIVIKDSDLNRVYEDLKNSGETILFPTQTNTKAGYYDIEISNGRLSKTKDFYVNEKAMVDFKIINDTVYITNIGNIPYNKSVMIDISGKSFVKKIDDLLPGETKEFYLSGKDSYYDVLVKDDLKEESLSNVPLTGNAISVSDSTKTFSDLANTPIAWIILIIILGAAILFLFRDIFKKKSVAYPKEEKQTNKNKIINISATPEIRREINTRDIPKIEREIGDKRLSPILNNTDKNKQTTIPPVILIKGDNKTSQQNIAEQSLVMDGHKSKACVIAIKLKGEISKFAKENLDKALQHAYSRKGAVFTSKDYTFIIFSPLITKTFKNEITAIKSAEKIVSEIAENNRKFSDKIIYGIGINSGEIINKIENKKLKFTSLGGLTILAKKLADNSSPGEILLSKETYNQAMTEVKADKKDISGIEAYVVKKVADYEKNDKFIKDFIKRENKTKDNNTSRQSLYEPKKSNNNPLAGLINDSEKNKPQY